MLEHVIVALLAEGHILVEDYPGVGKTALARALSRSIDCAVRARAVHRRPAARRHRRHQRLQPARAALRVPPRPDLRQRRDRRRGQPRLAEDAVRPARVHAGARRSPSTSTRTSSPARSSSSRRRTRSSTRAPTRCPRRRSTASWSGSSLGYPSAAEEAGHARRPRGAATACSTSSRSPTAPRCSSASDAARRVHASQALRDYIVALLRHTRGDDRVELGASPRAGLMLLRAAKARALAARPRPRAARRRPGARRRRARAPHHARPRGRGRRGAPRSSPTRSPSTPAL